MDRGFWLTRWKENQLGWHRDEVHNHLIERQDWFLGGGPHRVLVPLCGKSVDLDWLARRGHRVIGIELSPIATEALFENAGRTPHVRKVADVRVYRHEHLTVLSGDLLEMPDAMVGTIDRVWDRGALVALTPKQRAPYIERVRRWLAPAGRVLLAGLTYNPCDKAGPPHSIAQDVVRSLYEGADVDAVVDEDVSDEIRDTWQEAGMNTLSQQLYQIDRAGLAR